MERSLTSQLVLCVCAWGDADIRMTNVPDIRVDYRHETLMAEHAFIQT